MDIEKKFVPALRFPEYENSPEWKEALVKDICSIGTGKSNSQDQVENGEYPFFIRSEVPVRSNRYLYDCEAVITIGDGKIGKVFHYIKGKFDLHQRCYKMSDFKRVDGKFFYYFFSSHFYDRAMRMSAKATVDSVRLEMISEMPIYYPTISEQRKIAECLSSIDTHISSVKEKLEQLKAHKKSLLQKLFPQHGKNLPGHRFPGFETKGNWEIKPLGNIVERITDKAGDSSYLPVSISAGIGFIDQKNKFGRNISGKQYENYIVLKKGEFAYNKGNSIKYPQGCVYQLKEYDVVACPNVFICFRIIDNKIDANFLGYYFDNNYHGKQLQHFITSSVRSNGLLNINANDFFSILIPIPSLDEQLHIVQIISSLDQIIVATDEKLKLLEAQKKGLLLQLFPFL